MRSEPLRQAHPTGGHGGRATHQRITTTAPTMIPLLRVLMVIGLVAVGAVVFYQSNGLGLLPLDTAVFALGVGLAVVSGVLLLLLISLRGSARVAHRVIEQEVAIIRPAPQPAPAPVPVHAIPVRGSEPAVRLFPKIDPHNHIVRIRDMDDRSAVALNRAGVYTLADLRERDASALAVRAGLPTEQVEHWRAEADLMRVPGIGPEEAALLARHGVRSVNDLACADNVRLTTVLAEEGPVRQVNVDRRPMTPDVVSAWIQNARKEMPTAGNGTMRSSGDETRYEVTKPQNR